MPSVETIITRERLEVISKEINMMLGSKIFYQFKIRLSEDSIRIIPHCKPVEVVLHNKEG